MRVRALFCLSAAVILVGAASTALADVPDSINYQGILLDSGGDPVTTTVSVVFTIYDDPTAGVALWTETQPVTPDAQGRFNVLLGNVAPLNEAVFDEPDRYLEVQVTGDPPMTPRVPFVTVPYAYRVATVDGSTGGIISGNVDIQSDLTVSGRATIGPGHTNTGVYAFVAGKDNIASSGYATVSGGSENTASNGWSTVGGGNGNTAGEFYATVSGGWYNAANGQYSTVPGGFLNEANGTYSYAAGRRAQASHDGTFVWADQEGTIFSSTGPDQFLIRAAGGVGIGIPNPTQQLDVAGTVKMDGFEMQTGASAGYVLTSDGSGVGTWQAAGSGSGWSLTGNAGTTAGANFLGTTDNQALELKVNNARVFRLEPGGASPNLIGGYNGNSATTGVVGAVIGGGGFSSYANEVTDDYGAIGGGYNNQAGDNSGTTSDAGGATVAGGYNNTAGAIRATIGGGQDNNITVTGIMATIGGGDENIADNNLVTIGGGGSNTADGYASSIGGGHSNAATNDFSTVAGGRLNATYNSYTFVGGGRGNEAWGQYSVVGGGGGSTDTNLAGGNYSAILGGHGNAARGTASFIGGGAKNRTHGEYAVVCGGGGSLLADSNSALGDHSAIGGGARNIANDWCSTVGGGYDNTVSVGAATVSGGQYNAASGYGAVVAGGSNNTASGSSAAIPGGTWNTAAGDVSFAAGFNASANHDGAFVWADATGMALASTGIDQFLARASGGVTFYTNSAATTGVTVGPGGGAWSAVSSRELKRNIRPVDGAELLEKLAQLEISRWSYKSQDERIEHIGPMAQDFYRLFGVGDDDKTISTLDPDGIALAAIQELYSQNVKQRKQIDELEAQLAEVQTHLQELLREKE